SSTRHLGRSTRERPEWSSKSSGYMKRGPSQKRRSNGELRRPRHKQPRRRPLPCDLRPKHRRPLREPFRLEFANLRQIRDEPAKQLPASVLGLRATRRNWSSPIGRVEGSASCACTEPILHLSWPQELIRSLRSIRSQDG